MLSGAFGGYTGCISVSRSVLNFNSGGTSRLSGLTVAAISALMLAVAPMLLGYMPKFVLGGLLIYLGADQLHRWIIESRRRLSVTEYLSLLAIIVIIVQWGFIAGVLIGVVIGCATFALSASRIDSIKYGFDGSEYRSSLDRSRDDQAVLSAHGGKIQGLNLQSYLFFGSANRLYQHVKALLARHPECRFLVFDFKLVTGINSSAAYSFAQIKRSAHDRGIKLVLVHLPPPPKKPCDRASSSRTRSASSPNWTMRWSGARTRSSPSIRASSGKKPPCATGSPRFSAPSTTPRS